MRKRHTAFVLLLLMLAAPWSRVRAQTFDYGDGLQAMTSLDGLWRFHTGDDPAWANPNFDDSQWPLLRSDRDWAKQGYKGYSGVAWYRFQVIVPAGKVPLSLLLPRIVYSYQIYANGSLIGTYGKMPPHPAAYSGVVYSAYALPRTAGSEQKIAIAIRVWLWPSSAKYYGGGPIAAGAMVGPTTLVQRSQAALYHTALWNHSSYMILELLQTLAGFAALALFLMRRSEREYLWFSVFIFLAGAESGWYLFYAVNAWNVILSNALYSVLSVSASLAEIAFYLYLLKAERTPLFWTAIVCLLCLMVIGVALYFEPLHLFSTAAVYLFAAVMRLPMYVWIATLLITRARQKMPDARLLLAPVLLQKSIELFQYAALVTFALNWQHGLGYNILLTRLPFPIGLQQATDALFLFAVVAILVYRFTRTRSHEERYANEFEAARNVQSLLISATAPSTPGFAVESVYIPASEVGGDFFQVLPGEDGSLLIVVGDVSGKGLKAAMTVSAIVGALRNERERRPAEILSNLNGVLHGQVRGFVTCCAALIHSNGAMTIANAGHLAPYLNGAELAVESGLPLGILAEMSYEETSYQFAPDDRLTFVSDGVVEATNPGRDLFGFERTEAISNQAAIFIAEAAKSFGQVDDISVLSVTRLSSALTKGMQAVATA